MEEHEVEKQLSEFGEWKRQREIEIEVKRRVRSHYIKVGALTIAFIAWLGNFTAGVLPELRNFIDWAISRTHQ